MSDCLAVSAPCACSVAAPLNDVTRRRPAWLQGQLYLAQTLVTLARTSLPSPPACLAGPLIYSTLKPLKPSFAVACERLKYCGNS